MREWKHKFNTSFIRKSDHIWPTPSHTNISKDIELFKLIQMIFENFQSTSFFWYIWRIRSINNITIAHRKRCCPIQFDVTPPIIVCLYIIDMNIWWNWPSYVYSNIKGGGGDWNYPREVCSVIYNMYSVRCNMHNEYMVCRLLENEVWLWHAYRVWMYCSHKSKDQILSFYIKPWLREENIHVFRPHL